MGWPHVNANVNVQLKRAYWYCLFLHCFFFIPGWLSERWGPGGRLPGVVDAPLALNRAFEKGAFQDETWKRLWKELRWELQKETPEKNPETLNTSYLFQDSFQSCFRSSFQGALSRPLSRLTFHSGFDIQRLPEFVQEVFPKFFQKGGAVQDPGLLEPSLQAGRVQNRKALGQKRAWKPGKTTGKRFGKSSGKKEIGSESWIFAAGSDQTHVVIEFRSRLRIFGQVWPLSKQRLWCPPTNHCKRRNSKGYPLIYRHFLTKAHLRIKSCPFLRFQFAHLRILQFSGRNRGLCRRIWPNPPQNSKPRLRFCISDQNLTKSDPQTTPKRQICYEIPWVAICHQGSANGKIVYFCGSNPHISESFSF